MKFVLDENLSVKLCDLLPIFFPGHEFHSVITLGLEGTKDPPLIYELSRRGFQTLITRDRGQLRRPHELQALIDTNTQWICPRDAKPGTVSSLLLTLATEPF